MQDNLHELIAITKNELGISEFAIEKDFYVTKAVHALSEINDASFQLIFQGGTCLAKAHQLVRRMSEDCNFRISSLPSLNQFSQQARRNSLRSFRKKILTAISDAGFVLDDQKIHVSNAGQFMRIELDYPTLFPLIQSMRQNLLLEFISIETKIPILQLPVTTLIKQTLRDKIDHPVSTINCVSVLETAAEKWVAFTRRLASINRGYRAFDGSLIRHLYDLHIISQAYSLGQPFTDLVICLISEDKNRYKNQNPEYDIQPAQESKTIINSLHSSTDWQKEWDAFMQAMVFNEEKVSYDMAVDSLINCSKNIIDALT